MTNDYKPRFQRILDEAYALFERKARDYEDPEHALRTFRLSADLGVEPWKGCLLRMGDKLSLLYTWVRDGAYSDHDEPAPETLLDVIIYATLTIILLERRDQLKSLPMDDLIQMIKNECQPPSE